MSGVVRRFERSDVTIDLGKIEALLPNRERVPTEEYQIGERIRCSSGRESGFARAGNQFFRAPIRSLSSSCSIGGLRDQ